MNNPQQAEAVLEIAIFRTVEGVADDRVLATAEDVHKNFLSKYEGVNYRETMKAADGTWVDWTHWSSEGDFARAAAEVFTDPAAAKLMEIIDMSSLIWFHAFSRRRWSTGTVPGQSGASEAHLFRLVGPGLEIEGKQPASEDAFVAAMESAQSHFEEYDGFVERELLQTGDGWWLEVTHWRDETARDAAATGFEDAMMAGESWISPNKNKPVDRPILFPLTAVSSHREGPGLQILGSVAGLIAATQINSA